MDRREAARSFILQRRSIRKYTPEQVAPEDVLILLEAAMAAPSANNYQPWHLIVIDRRDILDALAEAHPYGKMLKEATLAIAVVGDSTVSRNYWIQDCSAATQNILLAAAGLGLGAVWLGVYPREQRIASLKQILSIPEGMIPLSLISIGHPAEKKEPRTQLKQEKIHRNGWIH